MTIKKKEVSFELFEEQIVANYKRVVRYEMCQIA